MVVLDHQGRKDLLDEWANEDFRVRWDLRDHRENLPRRVNQEIPVPQANREHRERLESVVQLDRKACKDSPGRKALWDLLELRVIVETWV